MEVSHQRLQPEEGKSGNIMETFGPFLPIWKQMETFLCL